LTHLDGEKPRRVVPRWRYSFGTIFSAEHSGLGPARILAPCATVELRQAKQRFDSDRNVITAADLVACAVAYFEKPEAQAAAEFLLRRRTELKEEVIKQAEWVQRPDAHGAQGIGPMAQGSFEESAQVAGRVIAARRRQIQRWQYDAIAWLDLARAYAVLGLLPQSERAMKVALQLAPDHRVVLRLSARLALHTGRLDDAYHQIARHRRTPHDPWLISAEISFAQIVGRKSRFTREAKSILSGGKYSPAHTSELAGALATLELAAGKHRVARARYGESLRDPTENAVAQAVWAGRTDSSIVVPAAALELPGSFEANYRRARRTGDWTRALEFAREWLLDEPYSSGPAIIGSSLASMAVNDCATAEAFARAGLKADPTEHVLLNNLAVALARQNRLPEANAAFSRISRPFRNGHQNYVDNATRGLLAFRAGELDAGRQAYAKSDIEAPDPDTRRLVLLHWAREEKAFDHERYLRLIERSNPEPGKAYDPLIESLRRLVTASPSAAA